MQVLCMHGNIVGNCLTALLSISSFRVLHAGSDAVLTGLFLAIRCVLCVSVYCQLDSETSYVHFTGFKGSMGKFQSFS